MVIEFLTPVIVDLAGTAFDGVVENVGGGGFERFCSSAKNHLVDTFKKKELPLNHDLQRLYRLSSLEATLWLCHTLAEHRKREHQSGQKPPYWEPEGEALRRVWEAVDAGVAELSDKTYVPPSEEALKQIELLMQPRGGSAAERVGGFTQMLRRSALDEFGEAEPPRRWRDWLLNGWTEPDEAGNEVPMDWFALVCLFFQDGLKKDEATRAAFQNELLAKLVVQERPLTLDDFDEQLGRFSKNINRRLRRIEDKMDTIHLLVRRALRRPLHEKYAGLEVAVRVEEIVDQYAALFVGREGESQAIDEFLQKNRSGVLSVTAPAGFGKTALLANWLRNRHGQGCFIAAHIFSPRYEVTRSQRNALENLLRQCRIYYGLPNESLPDDESRLRGLLLGLLSDPKVKPHRNEPLILLLDGLDEADGLFEPPLPSLLPDGVFVIVSGRAAEGETPEYLAKWVARSGPPLHLNRLPRLAIAEWLRRAGDGELRGHADDAAFVGDVDKKTEGYPLYLDFLVDELVQRAQQGAEVKAVLDQTPKGFEAYVQKQYEALGDLPDAEAFGKLFATLTVALGPLNTKELIALKCLKSWGRAALPWEVTRWFQTSRSEESTHYLFAHPKLAEAFARALDKETDLIAQARNALLDFCGGWHKHEFPSPYAFRHYPDHLREAKQTAKLYALARDTTFQEAQARVLPHEPNLPLRTLQTALLAAADTDDAAAMAEFSLAHARQIILLSRETPLDALKNIGLARALEITDTFDPAHRTLWHLLLCWRLSHSDDVETARTARSVLQRLLRAGEGALPRFSGWQENAASWLLASAFEIDSELAQRLVGSLLSDDGRQTCCVTLASRNRFDDALATAQQIENEWSKAEALSSIAQVLAGAGKFDDALATAQQIEDERTKAEVLSSIAQALAGAKLEEQAGHVFGQALATAQQIKSERRKAEVLSSVAQALARVGRGSKAVETADLVLTERDRHLPRIAAALAESDKRGDSSRAATKFPNFKRLLVSCAYDLNAAYQMGGLLANLYPEQADKIATIVTA